jgi:hypothetical protein
VHASTLLAEPWNRIDGELRRRRVDTLRAQISELTDIDPAELDELLDPVPSEIEKDPRAVLRDVLARAGDETLLVALYVYGLCLQKWERSEDYDRIEHVGEALAAVVDEGSLAGVVARRARLVADETTVEDALSCSCPVALGLRALVVKDRLDGLLEEAAVLPGAGRDAVLADLERACSYYDAVADAAGAVYEFAVEDRPSDAPYFDGVLAKLERLLGGELFRDDVFESELRAHRSALAALKASAPLPRLRLDEARVTYVFPFSLRGMAPDEVVQEARSPKVVDELARIGLDGAIARELEVNDLWQRETGEAGYFGTEIELPLIEVVTTADIPVPFTRVELRLSSLGNHYLRASCELGDAGLHEVNQALRRGSRAMGKETFRFGRETWTDETFPGYGETVIGAVARSLGCTVVTNPRVESHVVVAARRVSLDRRDARKGVPSVESLESAVGSSLLFQPIRHLASALEEWIRYPAVSLVNLLGDEAYRGDLVVRTDNTTIAVMLASPEWLIEEYEEMVEFISSIPALFELWQRQIDDVQHVTEETKLDELRARQWDLLDIAREVRQKLTLLHSPALCRTLGQRRFLDRLWERAEFADLEADIERRLGALAAQEEAIAILLERRRSQRIEAVLAILAWASVVGVVDFVDTQFDVHGRGWIWFEVALMLGVLAIVLTVVFVDRGKPTGDR